MNRFFRALFISALTTGAAAAVVYTLKRTAPPPPDPQGPRDDTRMVDADRMTEEQRDLAVQELADML